MGHCTTFSSRSYQGTVAFEVAHTKCVLAFRKVQFSHQIHFLFLAEWYFIAWFLRGSKVKPLVSFYCLCCRWILRSCLMLSLHNRLVRLSFASGCQGPIRFDSNLRLPRRQQFRIPPFTEQLPFSFHSRYVTRRGQPLRVLDLFPVLDPFPPSNSAPVARLVGGGVRLSRLPSSSASHNWRTFWWPSGRPTSKKEPRAAQNLAYRGDMFYSAQILSKKGPLGTIWIAGAGRVDPHAPRRV